MLAKDCLEWYAGLGRLLLPIKYERKAAIESQLATW